MDIIPAATDGSVDEMMDGGTVEVEGLDGSTERTAGNKPSVTMAVLDGIVMGPSVSLIISCFKFFFNISLVLCL